MHLPPDAVDVLRAARPLRPRCRRAPSSPEISAITVIDVALAVDARLVEPAGDAAVLGRLEPAERQVLELPLELPDAEPVRERRIDLARLPGEVQTRGVVELARVPHAAQLVREAHEHQPRVGDDGEQHPAERIRLAAPTGRGRAPQASRRGISPSRPSSSARTVATSPTRATASARVRWPRRKERLDQGAGDDLALGVERGDDRRGFLALRPARAAQPSAAVARSSSAARNRSSTAAPAAAAVVVVFMANGYHNSHGAYPRPRPRFANHGLRRRGCRAPGCPLRGERLHPRRQGRDGRAAARRSTATSPSSSIRTRPARSRSSVSSCTGTRTARSSSARRAARRSAAPATRARRSSSTRRGRSSRRSPARARPRRRRSCT